MFGKKIRVYTTAKIIHAEFLKNIRNKWDEIYWTARWPVTVNLSSEKIKPIVYWLNDNIDDVVRSDYVILYAEQEDKLNISLGEIGVAIAHGKPIYFVGNNPAFHNWIGFVTIVPTMDEAIKQIKAAVFGEPPEKKNYYQCGEKICQTDLELENWTAIEGGNWGPMPIPTGSKIFSLHFKGGRVFDALLGWRDEYIARMRKQNNSFDVA